MLIRCMFLFLLWVNASFAEDVSFDTAKIRLYNTLNESEFYDFNVQVADTDVERRRGLMYVKSMQKNEGMLFVWENEMIRYFWMKNTFIPLDIIFFSGNQVHGFVKNMVPGSTKPRGISEPSNMALEINAGLISKLNVSSNWKIKFLK